MSDLIIDFPIPSIYEILHAIEKLTSYKSKIYFYGDEIEYGFVFREGCTQRQIVELEQSIGNS